MTLFKRFNKTIQIVCFQSSAHCECNSVFTIHCSGNTTNRLDTTISFLKFEKNHFSMLLISTKTLLKIDRFELLVFRQQSQFRKLLALLKK